MQMAMRLITEGRPKNEIVAALVASGVAFDAAEELVDNFTTAVAGTLPTGQANSTRLDRTRDRNLQRLLLLHLRDGVEATELSRYSKQQQTYNRAMLVQEGLAKGVVRTNPIGQVSGVALTEITSVGHDFLDAAEAEPEPIGKRQTQAPNAVSDGPKKLLFVSHSSIDEDLAEALVDLLESALGLSREQILCTSVEGCRLEGGDVTDDVLRQRISDAPAFISLLTKSAFESTYVLFELGARWGCNKHHIPLLAKGAGPEVLKEPLKARIALDLSKEEGVRQLIERLSKQLQLPLKFPSGYVTKLHKVVEVASRPSPQQAAKTVAPSPNSELTRTPAKPGSTLKEDAKRVLECFFDRDQKMTASQVAYQFGFPISVAKAHLDVLEASGFVKKFMDIVDLRMTGNTQGYVITPSGRQAIMDARGL